jgi:hypothetical protein
VNTVSAQYANPNTRYIVIPTGVDPSCSFRADDVPTSLNDCGESSPSGGEQMMGGGSPQGDLGVDFEIVLGMTGQPDAAAFTAWVAELSATQREQLAASIAALVGQEGGLQ